MARTTDTDVELGPDEVLVERKIVPAQRQHFSPVALIVLVAFAVTCGLIFYAGDRDGERAPSATQPQPTTAP
jgi:hypothetical protein